MIGKNTQERYRETEHRIVARHLVKEYPMWEGRFRRRKKLVRAVRDVSLEIPQGQIVGALGINGAGKTTTIRMLASVIEPTSGSLTMNGIDVIRHHRWVKERINVISGGERNLYWRLTARENLEYFGSLYGLGGEPLRQRIRELLETVGLTEAADVPVERYSKGMKQRLQIARGLINDPQYLFLDEPTLGLDIVIAREIRALVSSLAKERRKGLLLTTHYINEAEELCDYIYVLHKGRVIAQGTKEELKEIFQVKPSLVIQVKGFTPALRTELQDRGMELRLGENEAGILRIPGGVRLWTEVMQKLMESGTEIQQMRMDEPDLEDILIRIIGKEKETGGI